VSYCDEESTNSATLAGILHGERVNTLTHGLGCLISVVAGIYLVCMAVAQGDMLRIVGCAIFAASMIAVYAASTMSHAVSDPERRHFYRQLDQGFIYFLIVGTFTPFSLAYLHSVGWWLFLGLAWALAIFGFVSKVILAHRINGVAVVSYIALGWMPIIPAVWLYSLAPPVMLWLILSGGLCYTVGTIFLVSDVERYHFHGIWHLFVIAGSTLHFYAVLVFVALPVG
jgi:hemolysin III